jgi:curved DNA-binding protein CbpA
MALDERMDKELKDVALCYKALGIPFDSSPAEVERAYRSLSAQFNKDLHSPDPATRLKAKEDAELVTSLYEKITNSANYQRKMKERSHAQDEREGTQKGKTETNAPKLILMICPSCNNTISKGLKACPFCKKRIYSSQFEKIWEENLTSKKMLLTLSILSCLALVILFVANLNDIIEFIRSLQK